MQFIVAVLWTILVEAPLETCTKRAASQQITGLAILYRIGCIFWARCAFERTAGAAAEVVYQCLHLIILQGPCRVKLADFLGVQFSSSAHIFEKSESEEGSAKEFGNLFHDSLACVSMDCFFFSETEAIIRGR